MDMKAKMISYLTGAMPKRNRLEFERFIANSPHHAEQFEKLSTLLSILDAEDLFDVPEPSADMDQSFYAMLENAKTKQKESYLSKWKNYLSELLHRGYLKPLAFGLAMLLFGAVIQRQQNILGYSDVQSKQPNLSFKSHPGIDNSATMKELAVLSLLELPSSSKRLQAINIIDGDSEIQQKVVAALLNTLNNDPNVNVRLTALDALARFNSIPEVRAGLIESIYYQNSPLVQISIADIMLGLQEKRAVMPLKSLLEDKHLPHPVRERITTAVDELI